MKMRVDEILVREGRRELDLDHVRKLADSIKELGLLNPVTVDKGNILIAGLHRLEAVKLLEWSEIECTVSSLEGLQAELAEIDENIVRNDFSAIEYGEMLLRRKEIYETLHPDVKHGGDRKSEKIKATKCRFDSAKSFVQDTAEKLGVVPRTVERQIQTAKKLTPETKEIIKGADTKITKKAALKLSRLEPEQQKEAAALLAAKEIKSVDEYTATKAVESQSNTRQLIQTEELKKEQEKPLPVPLPEESCPSFKEMVADLKDTEKEYTCTPEIFLTEFSNFVEKLVKEMEWYASPLYEAAFSHLSEVQFAILRKQTDLVCSAARDLFIKVERAKKS